MTNNDSGTHDVQVWDVTNQGSWADEILNYNSTWQVTHLTVHNDDGTRIEQGWDLANQQTWKDVTTYFDVAGQKTQEFYHNDDGGYSSAGWDTTNVSPLANWFYQYNAQNQLVHYSVTYDNGQTYSA